MEFQVEITRLHDDQKRLLSEAKRYNVLECGRRYGKTTLGVHLMCRTAIDGFPAGWFAPTYKLLMPVWRELVTMLEPITDEKSETENRLHLVTGGEVECWSLEKPDAGRSRRYKRIVVDEGSVVRNLDQAWTGAIRPTLTDFQGDAWFLGTPKGRNYFHQLFVRGETEEPDWKSWRRGTIHNPIIEPEEIEAARRDLPEHIFNQEYLGIPAPDGGNPFGLDAIARCVGPMSRAEPQVWGWDLAKSVDWTVGIGLDRDGAVCRFERWQSPWEQTVERVRQHSGQTFALVDSTGVGDPVLESLQKGRSNFYGFKFTSPSKQQLMEGLALEINKTAITIPEGPIRAELESFEYEYKESGVRYSAPEGLHDDCVCALALAVKAWREKRGLAVSIVETDTRQSPWRMN